jgi:acyl carrier protein
VAYVVLRENAAEDLAHAADGGVSVSELRAFLQEKLPGYMVPSALVVLPAFPLTPNGKIDRAALAVADMEWQPQALYVAPRSDAEQAIAGIWQEILHVDRVGVHDNFFELGGHSLMATQVISRLRNCFALELPLSVLFDLPTVAGLAELVGAAAPSSRCRVSQSQNESAEREEGEI